MILRRIEIGNLRKFGAPVILGPLPDGLVVVAGDNEEGKSTVLSALRAAFFYKHSWKGKLTESLLPHGSNVSPEVSVEFELEGKPYRLHKAFGHKPVAELTLPGGERLHGDAAEDQLAGLLGTAAPKRSPQTEAGLGEGPLGLLWLHQGSAWSSEVAESGRNGLQDALRAEVGDVLGGPRAKALAGWAQTERDRLLTPVRSEPTGEFKTLGDRIAVLTRERGELLDKVQGQAALREALVRNRARLQGYEADLPLRAEQQETAQRQAGAVQLLQEKLGRLQAQQRQAAAEATIARQQRERLDTLRRQIQQHADDQQKRQDDARQARGTTQTADDAVGTAVRKSARLQAQFQAAELRLAQVDVQVELAGARRRHAELTARLAAARAAADAYRSLAAQAGAVAVDEPGLNLLRRLDLDLARAEAQLDAAATRVELHVLGGQEVQVAGQAAGADWSGALSQRTEIRLGSEAQPLAAITIIPAGSAANPRSQRDLCLAAWQAAAGQRGVSSLAEAERQAEQRQRWLGEAGQARNERDRIAPEGTGQLELELETVERQMADWEKRDAGPELPARELDSARLAAAAQVQAGRNALSEAAQSAQLAQKDLDAAQAALATAAREAKHASDRLEAAQAELDPLDQASSEATLQARIAAAQEQVEGLELQSRQLRAELAGLDPEGSAQRLAMARQAQQQLERDTGTLRGEIENQRGQLASAEAWGEQLQRVETEQDWAGRRHAALQRRAAAFKLLTAELERARAGAEAQVLAPITGRIVPLLQRLLPGSEIALGQDLQIEALQRQGRREPFASLSHGTREQLAVLVRLAFADLLRAKGQPSITILDDAPAYADDARLGRMLEILQTAAQGGQILIFTCRERDFRPSGAPIFRFTPAAAHAAAH